MVDGYIGIDEPTTIDKKADTEEITVGANTVHRERVQIAGATATQIAGVTAAEGLDVDVTRLPALVAGTANIGDVDVLTLPALVAGTANIGDVDILTVPAPLSTTGGGTEATALRVTLATDSTGLVSVDDNSGSLTVDQPTGTNLHTVIDSGTVTTVSTVTDLSQQGGVAISLNTGVRDTGTQRVTIATNDVLPVVGTIADDSPTPGAPVMTGGTAKSPDGTTPGAVSAENDVTRFITDLNRRQYVNTVSPWMWSYHEDSSSALTDASVQADPGDGFAIYVTDIIVSTGAATALNIFFEEGATKVLGPYYLEAVAGRGLVVNFTTPKKITASTALTVTTSAAIAHSIDVCGFIAAV